MTCPFLLQEVIFSKKNPINLPLRDGPNGAQALAASGGEGRKHSADVHPRACRGHPPDPNAACGRNFWASVPKALPFAGRFGNSVKIPSCQMDLLLFLLKQKNRVRRIHRTQSVRHRLRKSVCQSGLTLLSNPIPSLQFPHTDTARSPKKIVSAKCSSRGAQSRIVSSISTASAKNQIIRAYQHHRQSFAVCYRWRRGFATVCPAILKEFFNPDRSWPSYLVPFTPNGENHGKRANIKVTKQRKFLTRPLCAVKLCGVC